jgi:hypothetical protein
MNMPEKMFLELKNLVAQPRFESKTSTGTSPLHTRKSPPQMIPNVDITFATATLQITSPNTPSTGKLPK